MTENKKNNLKTTYTWFVETLGKGVSKATVVFFENEFNMSLTSITTSDSIKENPLLKGEMFYTCQIPIKNKQHITLRATSDFIRIVFHSLFGSNYPVFELEKLTELETHILNGFFEHIVKEIDPFLIKEEEKNKINPLNKANLNFIFLIKNLGESCGKICVTVPSNRIEPREVKLVENFKFEDFISNFAYVDLIAGFAKISLSDLKNLDRGDILVLEKSNVKTMTISTPTVVYEFKVNIEPSLMIDFDGELEEETFENVGYKENNMSENKTMWDDIQIEVSAEFKKVKMTLGELKQISKGLVIDLGEVMNNEISLLVENKAVAKGELVIINDKYGVRITDVFANKNNQEKEAPKEPVKEALPKKQAPQAPQAQQQPPMKQQPQQRQPQAQPPQRAQAPNAAPPAPKPQAQQNKEDFDYSNFEE